MSFQRSAATAARTLLARQHRLERGTGAAVLTTRASDGGGEETTTTTTTSSGGEADVASVLRSTQGAHKLLRAWYLGQEKAKELTRARGIGPANRGFEIDDLDTSSSDCKGGAERERLLMGWYDEEMPSLRVRPTALQPLVQFVGFAGGFLSRLPAEATRLAVPSDLSQRATRAVEDAFADHLNDQIRELHATGEGRGSETISRLKSRLVETRDAERSGKSADDPLWGEDAKAEDEDASAGGMGGMVQKLFQKEMISTAIGSIFRLTIKN